MTSLNPRERLDNFQAKNLKCLTCRFCTDVNLFGETFCSVNDFMPREQHSIAHGWNWPNSYCENHTFKESALDKEHSRLIRKALEWEDAASVATKEAA